MAHLIPEEWARYAMDQQDQASGVPHGPGVDDVKKISLDEYDAIYCGLTLEPGERVRYELVQQSGAPHQQEAKNPFRAAGVGCARGLARLNNESHL